MRSPMLTPTARAAVQSLAASQIREVANAGIGDPELLPFWFGEPDEITPAFIRDEAAASLARGETFYTHNFGIPELRQAIAAYVARLHRPVDPETIAVTASGMSALMLTVEALVAPGDRVVVVTPLWPNLVEIPKVLSAEVTCVPLEFTVSGWTLDLDRLLAALTPDTRALMINSPNNPTGWTLTPAEQQTILAHCRTYGIWIIADDVYERLYYGNAPCAPSFLEQTNAEDRLVSTNSFSKAWSMTGWRLGWIVAPPLLMSDLGKLIEYNTSCSPVFIQRTGVVAIERGEATVARTLARSLGQPDVLQTTRARGKARTRAGQRVWPRRRRVRALVLRFGNSPTCGRRSAFLSVRDRTPFVKVARTLLVVGALGCAVPAHAADMTKTLRVAFATAE